MFYGQAPCATDKTILTLIHVYHPNPKKPPPEKKTKPNKKTKLVPHTFFFK